MKARVTAGTSAVILILTMTGVAPVAGAAAKSEGSDTYDARALRTILTHELGMGRPTGIAWDADRSRLLVTGSEAGGTELIAVSPDEQRSSRRVFPDLAAGGTPVFNPRSGRLTVLDDGWLHGMGAETRLRSWPSKAAARVMGRLDPAGAVYSEEGTLHVLEADTNAVVEISPEGTVARTSIEGLDGEELRGIAWEPETGLLFVADADAQNLYSIDTAGTVTSTWDLSSADISDLRAMTFAPSGDNTDPVGEQSLYIVDGGDADRLGGVTEVSLVAPTVAALTGYDIEPTVTAAHTTSTWSPSSPDPSGVTAIPGNGLLVSDGEVEEMPIYAGTNLWGAETDGTQSGRTGTTHPAFSDEPTGLEYRPSDGHLFVSDDTSPTSVYEVPGPGADGTFGTADDPAPSSLRTSSFASSDPEGVAYDSKRDDVLIIDGLGAELYRVDLGADHVFGGDDVITHVDVEGLGILDPEGLVYDAVRDTVVVLDDDAIWELDQNGSLLGRIGISSLSARTPAGITIAPASDGSGARHYYLVARGVDNDSDPTENDGMMYEVGADVPPVTNRPPTADAGADVAVDVGQVVQLTGSGTDDGLPSGTLTYRWTQQSGPGTAAFGSPASASTTATFSAVGTYVLRLTVSDSSLSAHDDVVVDVYEAGGVRTTSIRMSTGSDDAREGRSGGGDFVNLARAHDMLGQDFDQSNGTWYPLVTGMRFPGIPIPRGGEVVSARIQFESYSADTAPASLAFRGEASDNAPTYEAMGGNISSRPDTTAEVTWSPGAWQAAGQSGPAQLSPDLSRILQEVVDRPGWAEGNAAAFTVTGTGRRTAKSYESNGGPVLVLEYRTSKPVNQSPTVSVGPDQTVTLPGTAELRATVNDDGLPNPPGAVTTQWSKVSGPGTVTFGDATARNTTASFSAPGQYTLRLTASDSALTGSDELNVAVGTGNQAPVVDAGPSRNIVSDGSAALDGTVSDDGLPNPPGAVTTQWSRVSGPGNVTFGDASAVDTSATFSAPGAYVLRLTASDSVLSSADEVTVRVRDRARRGLTVKLSESDIRLRRRAWVEGHLSPSDAEQTVRLQRWNGLRWRTVRATTLAAGEGDLRFPVSPGRSGRFRFRVVAPAFADYAAEQSAPLVLRVYRARVMTVRPRPDVVVVKNTGAVWLNLDGWRLLNRRTGWVVELPRFPVRPGARVRIHSGRGASDRNDLYLGKRPMWGPRGAAVLRDRAWARVSRLRY